MWTNWHGLLWLVFTNKRLQVMSVLSKLQSIFCFFFYVEIVFYTNNKYFKIIFSCLNFTILYRRYYRFNLSNLHLNYVMPI